MITEIDNDILTNEEQTESVNNMIFEDYLFKIQQQMMDTQSIGDKIDYIELFCNQFLMVGTDGIQDSSIYIDERLSESDRDYFRRFREELIEMYRNAFGIELIEPNMRTLYNLYKVFILNLPLYFIYYLNGLQKLTDKWVEEIPNFQELTYDYFRNNIEKNIANIYDSVSNYISYILQSGLYPDNFVEICLYESEGNALLSELYIEVSNNRINSIDSFFKLKLNKILSFNLTNDTIMTQFIETNNLFN